MVELVHAKGSAITARDAVFAAEYNEPLIHQVVVAHLAGGRSGTKAQKNRAAVRGGGKKPWRQKGTGNARAGTKSSPIWRSGGVAFAAQPRDFTKKVNKKMYRGAICAILSELVRTQRLVVVDAFEIDAPKTKLFLQELQTLEVDAGLIITAEVTKNLYLAARNVPRVTVIDVNAINPVNLLQTPRVIITKAAIKQIEEWLG